MLEFGTITLYREKSTVHKFSSRDDGKGNEPVLVLRSNRVTIPIKTTVDNINVVVRGQNVPSTLRMTALVIDEFRRDPGLLHDAGALDWESFWARKVSAYENDYNPDIWVSLYVGSQLMFTTRQTKDAVDVVESVAGKDEVTEDVILKAAGRLVGDTEDLVVEHDLQTAFVFQPFSTYHRAAILERRDRKAGSFAISVFHPTPQKPVRLSHFIAFCADMMETLTLKSFLDRVQDLIAKNKINQSGIMPSQVQATRNRRRELMEAIDTFEKANKVNYRPERPKFV
jgi:hypothetical protein